MNKRFSPKIILAAILLFFLVTRLYRITDIPVSLYWDEVSIGYNAYSILTTGKDEWGIPFPLHFKAFGEYKLPAYIYATVLPLKIFGLNPISVKLPAVIFSLFNILLTYFVAKKVTGDKMVGLMSAFFLSISPYFFIFSRNGYEATLGLTFFLLSFYLFLIAHQRPVAFLISGLSLVLSLYTYNGYRILAPLAFFIFSLRLATFYRFQPRKFVLVICTGIIFILGSYPLINFLQTEDSISRFQAIGIENLDRKKVFIGFDIAKNYLAHFNPDFLFLNGDKNLRSQQQGFGQLFIYDLGFLLLGLLYLRKNSKISRWPLVLLLLSFLPASVTREAPHSLRSLSAAPFFSIIAAFGVKYLQDKFPLSKGHLIILVVGVYLGSFIIYFNNFINVYPKISSSAWQEDYRLIYQQYSKKFNTYNHVLISDRYAQPYIFALFYQGYDPDKFRSSVVYNTDIRRATSLVKSFDKFIFDDVDFNHLPSGKTLIFTHPTDRLNELWVSNILYHQDGSVAFYVYEYENK